MLVLGRRAGEGIMIGHDVKVTVISVAGDKVRIGIEAPRDIDVHREEVYLELQRANLEAASASADRALSELRPVVRSQGSSEDPAAPVVPNLASPRS